MRTNHGATYPLNSKKYSTTTEVQSNPLHKDTDLGYFAGLAMQGQFSQIDKYIDEYDEDWINPFIVNSVNLARELIKQLDEEKK